MKKQLLSSLLMCITSLSFAQLPLAWAGNAGGSTIDIGNAVTTDLNGNVIMAGTFNGTADFDFTNAVSYRFTQGSEDVFVASYTSTGALNWVISFGGSGVDYCKTVDVDGSGNIYVAGGFRNTVDFDPSAAVNSQTSQGGLDMFLAKFSSTGTLTYVNVFAGTQDCYANCIDVDANGVTYLTGVLFGTTDLDAGAGANPANSSGQADGIIACYSPTGTNLWGFAFGASAYDAGNTIKYTPTGNIFCGGYINGSVDFDPSAGNGIISATNGADGFVVKYTAAGAFVFVKPFNGLLTQTVTSLTVDQFDAPIVVGTTGNNMDLDPGAASVPYTYAGTTDAWIVKLDASGVYDWGYGYGASGADDIQSIVYDPVNAILYTCGSFTGTFDFDPSPSSTEILTSAGGTDGYRACINLGGGMMYALPIGSITNDAARAQALTSSGDLYITGDFSGLIDFDNSATNVNLIPSSSDAFLAKYGVCSQPVAPTLSASNDTICTGSSITASASGSLNSATVWMWYSGSCGNTYVTAGSALSLSPTVTTTYYVRGEGGCVDTSTAVCSPLTITVIAPPPVSITSPTYLCPAGNAVLQASGAQNYLWSTGDTTSSITVAYANAGSYSVAGTDAYGCSATAYDTLVPVWIDTTLTSSGMALTANQSGTYQWLDCGNNYAVIPGETSQTFTPSVAGSYAVQLAFLGCFDTSSCYIMIGMRIDDIANQNVNVYPNPVNNTLNIDHLTGSNTITVTTADGRVVSQINATAPLITLNTSEWSAGFYFVSVNNENGTTTMRVVKE